MIESTDTCCPSTLAVQQYFLREGGAGAWQVTVDMGKNRATYSVGILASAYK